MENSLYLLWFAFSAAWIGYLIFILRVSAGQKRIGEQIRGIRARLQGAAKR
jgi:hypothetical protein